MVSIKNIGFVALCAAATAFAADEPAQQVEPPKDAKALLEQLHQTNQDEIQLAQIAESKVQSKHAKDVAQQILKDHQQLDQQVTQLAQQRKLNLGKPSTKGKFEKQVKEIGKDFRDTLKDAQAGPMFDTLYLSDMVVEHGNDVLMLQAAQSKFQSDPDVAKLLSSTLPVIGRHQQMAAKALSDVVQHNQAVGGAGSEGKLDLKSRQSPSSPSGY